jgi:hypothetical protein
VETPNDSLPKNVRRYLLIAILTPVAPLIRERRDGHHAATIAIKLHSGEFCTKAKQGYYHRHSYTFGGTP